MRKVVLALAAIAVMGGVAAFALACDKSSSKASNAQASACPASKGTTAAAAAGSECPYHKAEAAKMAGGCDAAHKAACSADKNTTAAAGGCCAKDANGTACVNHVFSVADMHGECCVEKVEQALSHVKGVQAVYVDLETHKAYVCTGSDKVDRKAALKSLSKAGYKECSYVGTDNSHPIMRLKEAQAAKTKDAGKV
jgi:copper chaperone CopZ